jgi:lysophospholipase L1-like esterase
MFMSSYWKSPFLIIFILVVLLTSFGFITLPAKTESVSFHPSSEYIYDYLISNEHLIMNTSLIGKNIPISGNVSQMRFFYDALKTTKTKKVRIADYGDSGNEGDLITQDIRENLQKKYGGNGVGFLNITGQDITFRTSTKHSFSNNWKTVSVLAGKDRDVPFGMNGFVSIPQSAGSWVQYEAGKQTSSKNFSLVRLFYSNAKKSTIKYSFDNGKEETVSLEEGPGVKELILDPKKSVRIVKITASLPNQAHFFGVSLESGNGVYVDNFPWRGNTGLSFKDIPADNLKDFNNFLNYKLIILSYGANMLADGNVNFPQYEAQMTRVLQDLKKVFPETSIILVGLGDKSVKRGTKFVTDPNVVKMIESQRKIAQNAEVAFWDKFEAMGGMNSMVEWVNANPPLAAKDYGHLNHAGSLEIANKITTAILRDAK